MIRWVGNNLVVEWEFPELPYEDYIGYFEGGRFISRFSKSFAHIVSDYKLSRFKKRKYKMRKAK